MDNIGTGINQRTFTSLRVRTIVLLLLFLLAIALYFLRGGFIAARRLSEYAATVYHINSNSLYAGYNPVSSHYEIVLSHENELDSIRLGCDSIGNIYDLKRNDEFLANKGFPEMFSQQNESDQRQYGYLRCFWKYDLPDRPIITLDVQIRERDEVFPETDTAILEIMVERFNLYYNIVRMSNSVEIEYAKISYSSSNSNRCIYSISTEIGKANTSVDEILLSAELVRKSC